MTIKSKIIIALSALMLTSNLALAAEMDKSTKNVVVRGTAKGEQNVTIMIRDSEGKLAYIRETEINDGEYFTKFKFPSYSEGEYTISVRAGDDDVTSELLTAQLYETKIECKIELTGSNANKYFNEGDTIKLNTAIKNLFADEETYKIFVACYDKNGVLTGVVSGNDINVDYGYNGQKQNGELAGVTVPVNTALVKVMTLKENFQPISKAKKQAAGDRMFQDGDVVSVVGDSLTHMGAYQMFLEHFYQTRYPDREIIFYKKGVSGQTAYDVYNRLDSDVFEQGQNRMTLLIGHNDVAAREFNQSKVDNSIANIKKVIDKAQAEGIEITLVTPPESDTRETVKGYWGPADAVSDYETGSNANKKALAEAMVSLAAEKGINCCDLNALSHEINEQAKLNGDTGYVLTCNDRLHACPGGDVIFAYAIIKGQGATPTVAAVELNANGEVISTENCELSNLSTENGISYTYTPYSSPIGEVETLGESTNPNSGMGYADAQEYVDITGDLNQETIKITGLEDGNYVLTLNGDAVSTAYTAEELANGVNIALLAENPNQARAKEAWEFIKKKNTVENKLRNMQSTIWFGGDEAYRNGTWDEWYASQNVYRGYFESFPTDWPNKKQIEAEAVSLGRQAAELSKPISYTVKITKQ